MKTLQYTGLISAAFLGGLAANLIFNTNANVDAQDKKPAALKVVTGNEFVLESKDGTKKAIFGFSEDGAPNLFFLDADGGRNPQFANVAAETLHFSKVKALRAEVERIKTLEEVKDAEITVSHILISFAGRGTPAKRTKDEAEILANEVLAKVKKGDDFAELATEYTDDNGGGTYTLVLNPDPVAGPGAGKYARNRMVPAFGNVGWKLKVGEVGVAGYSLEESPYGWHIIKRIK